MSIWKCKRCDLIGSGVSSWNWHMLCHLLRRLGRTVMRRIDTRPEPYGDLPVSVDDQILRIARRLSRTTDRIAKPRPDLPAAQAALRKAERALEDAHELARRAEESA